MRVHALLLALAVLASSIGPASAELTAAERLGQKLFHEKRLSADRSVSCATCHKPELSFTNGEALARGVFAQVGDRNVPTLLNRRGTTGQFWDKRAKSLEDQAAQVIENPAEMGGNLRAAVQWLKRDPEYRQAFLAAFAAEPSPTLLVKALAEFERTLVSGEAPYDRYQRGEREALNAEQRRGMTLFFEKFKCTSCHSGPNFSDEKLNVRCYPYTAGLIAAPGQKFKTPTLRNLIHTAPYMHNGALATLEEAVEFYNPSLHLNARGRPAKNAAPVYITETDKRELVAFLKALSAEKP